MGKYAYEGYKDYHKGFSAGVFVQNEITSNATCMIPVPSKVDLIYLLGRVKSDTIQRGLIHVYMMGFHNGRNLYASHIDHDEIKEPSWWRMWLHLASQNYPDNECEHRECVINAIMRLEDKILFDCDELKRDLPAKFHGMLAHISSQAASDLEDLYGVVRMQENMEPFEE